MILLLALSHSTVYFEENFDNDDWEQNWVYSRYRPTKGDSIKGTFRLTSGAYYGNQRAQRGLQTMDEAAWYQLTSRFKKPMNSTGKNLVFQFTVRFENGYECSGGYLKLLNSSTLPLKFSENSPYLMMFGPDVCKPNTHKVMFIVNRNETNYDNHQFVDSYYDELTHAYTLIIFANRSYEIRLDGRRALGGDLDTSFELGGTETIPDPEDLMPEDWDNRKMIPDPDDVKPADWDDRPIIPDPEAQEPPEWREHVHGKWTPPLIQNPDYRGMWKPKMIQNPKYKGEWVPSMIPNPSYMRDDGFGVFDDIACVGIEVFQVQPGTIFDNILVTDDIEYAEKQLRENFLQYRDDEFAMYKRMLQDKAAEEELRRLREKEEKELTDEEFYTSSGSSEEVLSSTTEDEDESNFVFPSDEISDPPTTADFEFPYDVDHNRYFLEKKKMEMRISSSSQRQKWKEHRREKRRETENPEDVSISD